MPQSLSSWCKEHNLPKGSVHAKAKDLDFDTSQGLSDEAIEALSKEFNIVTSANDIPVNSSVDIHTGNHRGELVLPETPSSLDLSIERSHAPLNTVSDDDIDNFLAVCDNFVDGLRADYEHQQQVTQHKQQQLIRVEKGVQEVQTERLKYGLRSEFTSQNNQQLDQKIQNTMNQVRQQPPSDGHGQAE